MPMMSGSVHNRTSHQNRLYNIMKSNEEEPLSLLPAESQRQQKQPDFLRVAMN